MSAYVADAHEPANPAYTGRRRFTIRIRRTFLAAVAFLIVATYPGSPVLYMLLPLDARTSIALMGMILILLLWSLRGRVPRERVLPAKDILRFLLFAMLLLAIYKAIGAGSSMAARDAMSALICIAILSMRAGTPSLLLRYLVYLLACLLALSLLSVALLYAGALSFDAWSVGRLFDMHAANPIAIRHFIIRDGDYYFPLYLAVVPVDWNFPELITGITFTRQPLVFEESTYAWFFVAPPLLAALPDKSIVLRPVVIAVLVLSLIVSFSVWGILAAALLFGVVVSAQKFRSPLILYVAALSVGIALPLVGIEPFLDALGSNKAAQFAYFAEVVDPRAYLTVLGLPGDYAGDETTYGALFVMLRYGVVGGLLYTAVFGAMLWRALNVIISRGHSSPARFAAMAVAFSIAVGLKTPFMAAPATILLYLVLADRLGTNRARAGVTAPQGG